jgi:hypothetical protein
MIFICSKSSKELRKWIKFKQIGKDGFLKILALMIIAFGRFQSKKDNGWYVTWEAGKSSKNNECKGN